jgi:hypothetical protein
VLSPAVRQATATVKTDPLLAPVAQAAVAATTPAASIGTAKTDPLLAAPARAASATVTSALGTAASSRIPSSPTLSISAGSPARAHSRAPTLVGLPPPVQLKSSEELDWDVPTKPHSSPPPERDEASAASPIRASGTATAPTDPEPPMVEVEVEVDELPPESHPSGIGSKYVPKDLNAPPIVLKEEVQAAEAKQRQKLEFEHRSRRAATIIRMRAPDPVPAPVPAEEELSVPVRKSRTGMYLGAALVVLAGGVGAGALLQGKVVERAPHAVATAAPAAVTPSVTTEPAAAKAESPVVAAPSASQPAPPSAPTHDPEPAALAGTPVPATPRPLPAPPQIAVPTRPKAKPAPAPSPKPQAAAKPPRAVSGGSKPAGRSVIVRDTPF